MSGDRGVPQNANRSGEDGAALGGLPASAASVRARRARISGDERGEASPGGALVSRPAKSQAARSTPGAQLRAQTNVAMQGGECAATGELRDGPRPVCSSQPRLPVARARRSADHVAESIDTKVIGQRVDWLELAFQMDVSLEVLERLEQGHMTADEAGYGEVRLGGVDFAVRRHRQRDLYRFENADLRATFDLRAIRTWCLSVIVRAIYLAAHPVYDALALALRVAGGFGPVRAERLRRFDLAVDCIGFPLDPDVAERFVTTRARLDEFLVDVKDCDEERVHTHRNQRYAITGFTVAPGNPLMARIYDKTTELAMPGREGKRAIEHERWLASGWDGVAPVTRVEFQHRGAFLDEIGLRCPTVLPSRLDEVWQRDTRWLRQAVPNDSDRRTRWPTDPRWKVVSSARFATCAASPIQRSREYRGGVSPEHVFGTVISRLGASGHLARIVGALGKELSADAIAAMSDAEASTLLRRLQRALFDAARVDSEAHVGGGRDPRDQLKLLSEKVRGVAARFSSSDDNEEERA